jgi:Excalibur calcium-binding domain
VWGKRLPLAAWPTGTPVTTFYRSTRLYNIAMSYNIARGYNLDRDKDGIACEKR